MNNGITFRRNGEITLFGHLVGVVTCHDNYLWKTYIIDGRCLLDYTQKQMRVWVLRNSERLLKLAKSMTEAEKWEAINNAR